METIKRERSCGTVLYTVEGGEIYYLLIKSKKTGFCGLPKGHVEGSESDKETAIRETWEETSVRPVIVMDFRDEIEYRLKNGNVKTVVFFVADYTGQTPAHNDGFENMDYLKLRYDDAIAALSMEKMRGVLIRANAYIREHVGA